MYDIEDLEWAQKKYFLVQSYFRDLNVLSTVLEDTEESKTSSPVEPEVRSESPLPDLIIEKEKNRHDEPEEFYKELEEKMIRLWRSQFRRRSVSDYGVDAYGERTSLTDEESVTSDDIPSPRQETVVAEVHKDATLSPLRTSATSVIYDHLERYSPRHSAENPISAAKVRYKGFSANEDYKVTPYFARLVERQATTIPDLKDLSQVETMRRKSERSHSLGSIPDAVMSREETLERKTEDARMSPEEISEDLSVEKELSDSSSDILNTRIGSWSSSSISALRKRARSKSSSDSDRPSPKRFRGSILDDVAFKEEFLEQNTKADARMSPVEVSEDTSEEEGSYAKIPASRKRVREESSPVSDEPSPKRRATIVNNRLINWENIKRDIFRGRLMIYGSEKWSLTTGNTITLKVTQKAMQKAMLCRNDEIRRTKTTGVDHPP
ncbi:uncharacterized protein [Battus philenor]|uniref:uncharacterized protein n=1 Tax=Battus philenor TaxID=42288 RepID=UPI0035CFC776